MRSWIAISLVLGLLLLTALSFGSKDASVRSALIGGLTASVGSAVAFYFSTKSSDNARQDLLNATVRTDTVPNLVGRTLKDATSTMGTTSFQLVVAPGPIAPTDTLLIKREDPATDSTIPKCSSVTVYFEDK